MANVAKKSNPSLWKNIVSQVKKGSKGGSAGQWSARKAQLATKIYKDKGGKYEGSKSSENKLSKWTEQDWQYVNPKDEKKPKSKRGRYLPKKAIESLSSQEKSATNRAKREATKKRKTKAAYSKKIAKLVRES